MRRRTFVGIIASGSLGWRLAARAQAPRRLAIVGVLFNSSPPEQYGALDALRAGLRDLGHVDGQNISIDARYADGKLERLPALAAELVAARPDVIVAAGPPAARALRGATDKVPIVLAIVTDPVADGLVTSLSHPGGNLTGLAFQNAELTEKRLEMLREAAPSTRRIAVLSDSSMAHAGESAALNAASALGFTAKVYAVQSAADFGAAFQAMVRDKAEGLMVLASPMLAAHRKLLLGMVAQRRLPSTYENRTFVDDGGLMSYGPSFVQMWRQSARYVDKILKGARPSDLPMEQPTKFELVVNLRAAKSLGLTIPQTLLLRADDVVQ
jgi:putative tryptophan/tyrosine transport system substrate-binding protein